MKSCRCRIDAALAEPVEDYDIDADLRLHKEDRLRLRVENLRLERERDEARAEVERLKKAVHTRACQTQSVYSVQCVCGADEHQRDLRTLAYQRGAEAMREAAAQSAFTTLSLHSEPCRRSELRDAVTRAINALPLPKEES